MTILAIILLIVLGILLLLLEFAVVPGITIAGIGGIAMLIASVYLAFTQYGTLAGFITLAFVIIVSPILVFRFFKTRAAKKMMLEAEIDGKVNEIEQEKIAVGDAGMAISRLAPMGKVLINGITVEAKSIGPYIDADKKVKVLKVLQNQIIVEPLNE